MKENILTIFLLFTSIAFVNGQSPEMLNDLNKYLQHIEGYGFSGQVLVAKNNEILFNSAYGFSDRFHHTTMSRETPIGIASLSKQFFAAAILKLQEAGKLSVNDPLSKFFDDVPDDKKDITIHHVLTHSSGMSISNDDDFRYQTTDTIKYELFKNKLRFKPGTTWQYSSAYSLLPMIIEKVTGSSFKKYISSELFSSAGLKNTSFEGEIKGIPANSYLGWKDNGNALGWGMNYRNLGRGDIISTADDLFKWHLALQRGMILTASSRKSFYDLHYPFDPQNGYGYGWFIHKENRLVIEHGGDAALGHNASLFFYPEDELVIIVLSNSRDFEGNYLRHLITSKIEKLFFENDQIDLSQLYNARTNPLPPQLIGVYQFETDNYLHILNDGSYTWVIPEGIKATSLFLDKSYHSEQWQTGFKQAKERTEKYLEYVQKRDIENLATVIGFVGDTDRALSYQKQWNQLTEALGPLHQSRITGAVSFREDVFIRVNLSFRDGEVNMTFFWSGHGAGPLMGASKYNRSMYQMGFPVRFDSERNMIIAVDIWNDMFYEIKGDSDNLIVDQKKFRKLGLLETD